MRALQTGLWSLAILVACPISLRAQADGDAEEAAAEDEVTITSRWKVLHKTGRRAQGVRPIAQSAPITPLDDLEFTGPAPGHPFVLGKYAADGKWAVVNGGIQLVEGHNAALKLARAKDFELEGVIEMQDYGGWFLLVGWDQGRGYSISNVTMKESGSPWFITEYRGDTAIEDAHYQLEGHEWRREQPFRVTLRDGELEFQVGKAKVLEGQRLENYSTGDVIFGVYDTRYGPRPVRITALRIRALEE
ncbi:MAG: hypothetical protein DWQ34_08030 [Planctomycetota bacterium]|nr:MAG: hypothetical protein DWQ29_13335 [Planctomycetota bacterium]REJ94675.1 MAG: hypothetical protein DWQ34_08030 [Planctomycetota bacterium]REK31365.1 MAG: hypothetical protein DWQ41_00505 [Planctomycetota bacterium]REK39090.1 MAG: hypothetical protein DWQ45_02545 [Planctomycetota bacterium]